MESQLEMVAKSYDKSIEFGRGILVIPQDTIRREMLWIKDEKGTKAISLLIELVRYGKQIYNYVHSQLY